MPKQKQLMKNMLDAAIKAAHPKTSIQDYHLPDIPKNGRLIVVGAGKAGAAMAERVESYYAKSSRYANLNGLVVTPEGSLTKTNRIKLIEASHPLPDQRSINAAQMILKMVRNLTKNDLVLVLLSGGASSLLCLPIKPLILEDKRNLIKKLFNAGATIHELNTVRQTFSQIKGGKLALACYPAKVHTIGISDVVGDQAEIIGSGPTVKPVANKLSTEEILNKYKIDSPVNLSLLSSKTEVSSSFKHSTYELISRPMDSLVAAAKVAQKSNYLTLILGDNIEGEAKNAAIDMIKRFFPSINLSQKWALISGGEVTVTMGNEHQNPDGGPNREFALSLALNLQKYKNIYALCADTDGIDGKSASGKHVAGSYVTPTTIKRAKGKNLDPVKLLNEHQSGKFFELLDDEIITQPTGTNVNDFRVILIN